MGEDFNEFSEEQNSQKGEYHENTEYNSYNPEPGDSGVYYEPNGSSYTGTEKNEPGRGLSIASLVLGIISIIGLCFCAAPLTGILAIIFGSIQLSRGAKDRGMCIAGIVTGAIGIILTIILMGIYVRFIIDAANNGQLNEQIYNEIINEL